MKRVVHPIQDGFCTICGDTEEWLTATGQEVEVAE